MDKCVELHLFAGLRADIDFTVSIITVTPSLVIISYHPVCVIDCVIFAAYFDTQRPFFSTHRVLSLSFGVQLRSYFFKYFLTLFLPFFLNHRLDFVCASSGCAGRFLL